MVLVSIIYFIINRFLLGENSMYCTNFEYTDSVSYKWLSKAIDNHSYRFVHLFFFYHIDAWFILLDISSCMPKPFLQKNNNGTIEPIIFSRVNPKLNVIVRLKFEIVYDNVAVEHYITRTSPVLWRSITAFLHI